MAAYPEAERAAQLAEERLRQLRPDVMDRYDRLHGSRGRFRVAHVWNVT